MCTRDEQMRDTRRGHPERRYFLMAFAISWSGAGILAVSSLLRRGTIDLFTGLMIFPAMLLGPSLSGVMNTWWAGGRARFKDLWSRVLRLRIAPAWYMVLLIPPATVLGILWIFSIWVSPVFHPNHFWIGASFGVAAGFLEEIGWMGFAFPALAENRSALIAALQLGILWALWHLPAIDYLGASAPHGAYWLPFFAVFALTMVAMRVLIAWAYVNTRSVWLAQLMHASSTGSLVVLSPHVTNMQETAWYCAYGVMLWLLVAGLVLITGSQLQRKPKQPAGRNAITSSHN